MERALRDRGSHYNQDEYAFCPTVFHLFAGSDLSEHCLAGLQGPLAGPHACSTSKLPLSGFLRHGYKNIWTEIEEM